MLRRKLTAEEIARISEERRQQEISAHPDKMISIRVEAETDESGEPIVWVHFIGECRSNEWKRCRGS